MLLDYIACRKCIPQHSMHTINLMCLQQFSFMQPSTEVAVLWSLHIAMATQLSRKLLSTPYPPPSTKYRASPRYLQSSGRSSADISPETRGLSDSRSQDFGDEEHGSSKDTKTCTTSGAKKTRSVYAAQ